MTAADRIRNVAIIAHIDHGKTTLMDAIFRSTHVFRDNQQVSERVMDNYNLERERAITIRSKHCTVKQGGCRVNIIDTPGHADFSGEVKRVLSMVKARTGRWPRANGMKKVCTGVKKFAQRTTVWTAGASKNERNLVVRKRL